MDIALIIFVIACLVIGLIGTILPAVPGVGLIFLGIFAYAWHFGFAEVGLGTLIALGIAAALSLLFDYLGSATPGHGGEIQLTDSLVELARRRGMYAYEFEGKRYDAGDKLGYLKAVVDFAITHPTLGKAFKDYIRYASEEHL